MREDVVAARNPHQPEAKTFHQFGHVAKRHILQRALGQALKQAITIHQEPTWAANGLALDLPDFLGAPGECLCLFAPARGFV